MNENAPLIIGISGIRGIVDQSLNPQVVRRFAAAFATWLRPRARVVLARDTRPSGAAFAQAAAAALQDAGCEVLELGKSTTPTAKLMVLEEQADGAIIITASHNPAAWNGLKLIRADGIFLNAAQSRQVEGIFHANEFRHGGGGSLRKLDPDTCRRRHLKRLLTHVDVEAIRGARLAVSADLCNGAGALLIPALLDELGVKSVCLNSEPNGLFAHDPEPVAANLAALCQSVREHSSAIGFAVDPDADRVALVDERGTAVGEDYTLALAVQARSARQQGAVVITLSTSQTVSDAARAHNCPVMLTPVGEVHVVEKMLQENALIGGEGNGGVILTEVDPGRDAAVGLAIALEALAHAGQPLTQLINALPRYAIEKRKVTCAPDELEHAVQRLRQFHRRALVHPVKDGSKLYLSGSLECPWIHLRASNTEPVVRIMAESTSAEEAKKLCDEVEEIIAQKR